MFVYLFPFFITVLRETGLGKSFFGGVAQPEPLRNILRQVHTGECSLHLIIILIRHFVDYNHKSYNTIYDHSFLLKVLLSLSLSLSFSLSLFLSISLYPSLTLSLSLSLSQFLSISLSLPLSISISISLFLFSFLFFFLSFSLSTSFSLSLSLYLSLSQFLTISHLYPRTLFLAISFFLSHYYILSQPKFQAYGDPKSVDDETLNFILQPGLLDGAADVFLDFISYR